VCRRSGGTKEHCKRRGLYFFYGKGNENCQLRTGFFVHQRIVPAIKKVGFISDTMSYVVLRGLWCNIIVLNMHAPTEEKNNDSKYHFYEELEEVSDYFPMYPMKSLLGDFNAKLGREDILKLTIGNESLREDSNVNGVGVVTLKGKAFTLQAWIGPLDSWRLRLQNF
jgi:hypothetical protein